MKKYILFSIALLGLVISACSEKNPVLTISGGKIQGVLTDSSNVMVYKGIPYAAPPVGDLRWKAPQPVIPWEGVKIADTFGPICPQPGNGVGSFYWKEFHWNYDPEQKEDCLYLNVYAPAGTIGKTNAKLPVAMWVHGGAFANGYGHEITMDGDAWAQRGVILVTINYRLGMLGFMSHPELSAENDGTSGNYGIMDQIAALQWIHDNIAQFGGDPDNVTVFGQSAGASSVKHLIASPLSKPMIAKAIIQSGGGLGNRTPEAMRTVSQERYDAQGKAVMDAGGLTDLQKMRAASYEELSRAQAIFLNDSTSGSYVRFSPHIDGKVIFKNFNDAALDNEIADIPYMIGCTAQDMGGLGGPANDRFCFVRDSLSNQPVYQYFFQRNPPEDDPADDTGAYHSSELWYMFHSLKNSWRPFTEADYALSDKMMDYWTNFAKYGDPQGGWKAYTMDEPYTQILDIE